MKKSSGYVGSKFVGYMFFEIGLNMEFDYFETYCGRMESIFGEEEQGLQQRYDDESADLTGYEKANHLEEFRSSYEYEFVTKIFPRLQRQSGLICLYSILERNLIRICEMQEEKTDNPVKMSDLGADGYIERARVYLEKITQIDLPDDSKMWKEIEMIQQLRNSCVHSNGLIKSGNGNLVKYIHQSKYLDKFRQGELFQEKAKDSKEPYQLIIKQGYLEYCITVFKEFFKDLFSKLEEKNTPKLKLI